MNRLICLLAFWPAVIFAQSRAASQPATRPATLPSAMATTRAFEIGHLTDPAIPESSGIVASRQFPGVFWTHNDSGNPPNLFAVNSSGKTLATVEVAATNRDWEDIAIDNQGRLYIGDIGNNNARYAELTVHRIDEPDPANPPTKPIAVQLSWRLRFPAKAFDCEGLFVWQNSGYVVSKYRDATPAGLYRFSLDPQKEPAVLEHVCDLPIRAPATGADISPDGGQVVVQTVAGPYVFDLPKPGDVGTIKDVAPRHVWFTHVNMEAACFVQEGILATTEKRNIYLFRWEDFGK